MRYLIRAELYATSYGDDDYFRQFYTKFREYFTVEDSVWKTLEYMYGEETANELQGEYDVA